MNTTPRVAVEFVYAGLEYRLIHDGIKYKLQYGLHSRDSCTKTWDEVNIDRTVFLLSHKLEELSK